MLIAVINEELKILSKWFCTNKLSLNTKKTNCIHNLYIKKQNTSIEKQ